MQVTLFFALRFHQQLTADSEVLLQLHSSLNCHKRFEAPVLITALIDQSLDLLRCCAAMLLLLCVCVCVVASGPSAEPLASRWPRPQAVDISMSDMEICTNEVYESASDANPIYASSFVQSCKFELEPK
mmetsp:Transcript_5895/g.12142  ORF Transcript_5895/g.12142 Transcript_5895/m.12142 type:complete len:129 (-) Transcript_5895:5-391(-)